MFLIKYLNLTDNVVCTRKTEALYADDTMFYTHDKNQKYTALSLQRQINHTSTQLTKWRLRLNTSKKKKKKERWSLIINFTTVRQSFKKGTEIDWSSNTEYLDIAVDVRLSAKTRIAEIIKRAKGARAGIKRKTPKPYGNKVGNI